MSPAPALSQFAMGPITQTDISGTTLITQAGPVLHMPPQQTFHPLSQDTGYTVERRSTFTAFHSPSEDLKRVVSLVIAKIYSNGSRIADYILCMH